MTSFDELQRSSSPADFQSLPQLLVGDIQVALRLLHAGVPEHQLDHPDVHAVAEQPAGAFVTQVVPVQVNLSQLGAVDASAWLGPLGVVTVGDEQQRFSGGFEAADILAVLRAEHKRLRPELTPPPQHCG